MNHLNPASPVSVTNVNPVAPGGCAAVSSGSAVVDRRPDPFDGPDALRGGTLPPRGNEAPPQSSARFLSPEAAALFPTPPAGVLVVLHLGSGAVLPSDLHAEFQGPGWRPVRVADDAALQPDVLASLTDLRIIPTGSVHAVFCGHGLERLPAHQVRQALAEITRVLRPTGIALIGAIDLQRVAELIAADRLYEAAYESPAGPISALDLVFGHSASLAEGHQRLSHRTGFTARVLGELLLGAGFAHVDINRQGLDLWALAQMTPPA